MPVAAGSNPLRLEALEERLDAALPQTQCTRCGYPNCRSYAQAISMGEAAINRCPPGGAEGVARLAAIAGLAPLALDPACGEEGARRLAVIDEAWCIGCTLCIKACPVDCIVGASKHMHTVIEAQCTGCELCLPACPVDCISLQPLADEPQPPRTGWAAWSAELAQEALQRYRATSARRQPKAPACTPASAPKRLVTTEPAPTGTAAGHAGALMPPQPASATTPAASASASELKQAAIAAALARARSRKAKLAN